MVAFKLIAFVVVCAAISLTVRLIMAIGDREAGVVDPREERPGVLKRNFATPEPAQEQSPRFAP